MLLRFQSGHHRGSVCAVRVEDVAAAHRTSTETHVYIQTLLLCLGDSAIKLTTSSSIYKVSSQL